MHPECSLKQNPCGPGGFRFPLTAPVPAGPILLWAVWGQSWSRTLLWFGYRLHRLPSGLVLEAGSSCSRIERLWDFQYVGPTKRLLDHWENIGKDRYSSHGTSVSVWLPVSPNDLPVIDSRLPWSLDRSWDEASTMISNLHKWTK